MLLKMLVMLAILLAPLHLWAQVPVVPSASPEIKRTAIAELESVVAEADRLDDKFAMISVKVRAAALVSLFDPERAELIFLDAWKFAKAQTDKDFEKEQAQSLILRHLFPRHPELARRLLNEATKSGVSSLEERATGHDPEPTRIANLAAQMVDEDPRTAAGLLEGSLSKGITPPGVNALMRLRERDALLSDYVVGKTLIGLSGQPDVVSLSGLHLLSVYLFPEGTAVEITPSLRSTQAQYFSTTYEVLRRSLIISDAVLLKEQQYTQTALRLRAVYQALVSQTLAALAPRFRPNLTAELNTLAAGLAGRLPADIAQMSKLTTLRLGAKDADPDKPEMAIALAIQNGDFEEAGRLIDDLKSEELRDFYAQLVAKVEARALLTKGDVSGALPLIRRVEDSSARLVLYLEALKAAQKERRAPLSNQVIAEARKLIPTVNRNGLQVRAILAFAAQLPSLASTEEAVDTLDDAVVAINKLPRVSSDPKSSTEQALNSLNDPASLMDAVELAAAFSAIGAVALERAVIEARKIEAKPVQLIARLEAAGEVIRIEARRPKSKPKAKGNTGSRG